MPSVIKNNSIQEADDNEVDVELQSPSRLVGTHANVIPMTSNNQSARTFYGARFVNQEMPLVNREAPLVQSLDPESEDGKSFEEQYGSRVGAKYFNEDEGEVVGVNVDKIDIKLPDGTKKTVNLYHNFPFNRKTSITNQAAVKVGDKLKRGQLLASSNYTDANGTQSMGLNARVALVPYKGFSMDDAIVVSESFAKRMTSEHAYEHDLQKDKDTKFGKSHFASLFPSKFTKEQLENLDENGMAKPGTVLKKGDPIILATRPKPVYSNVASLGKLGKVFRTIRSDASEVWEHDYPGVVTDSVDGKKNSKVFTQAQAPLVLGDKIVIRNGAKGIVSKILPDEQILRGVDGKPFDVLLNPLSLPSRVNTATLYELALGKVAAAEGKPIKVPTYTKPGESRLEYVKNRLKQANLSDTEEVFDPTLHEKLQRPITTGVAYITKLHHVVESKQSARGNSGYDQNQQPLRGGSESGQSKRLGGLETTALMAKGGYATLREGSTLRGQCFDEETEVLTRRGWVKWPDVRYDDELFTKNKGEGGDAWYTRPSQFIKYKYTGDLYGYEGKHVDWLVTPDHNLWGHPCFCSKNKPHRKLRTFTAESAYGKDGSCEAFGHVYQGSIPASTVLEFLGKDVGATRKTTDIRMTLADYCEFMGWWLSEGSTIVEADGRIRVIISQSKKVNPENFAQIEALLHRIGVPTYNYRRVANYENNHPIAVLGQDKVGDITGVRFNSRPLGEHLRQFGSHAWEKRIPDIIFEAPLWCRLAFLDAYIKGDGCQRLSEKVNKNGTTCKSTSWYIGTSSKQMIEDLQRLLVISGFGGWVLNGPKAGTLYYKHDHYCITVTKNIQEVSYYKKPAKQYKGHYKCPYDGYVYCATMPTGLLYVRRNGKAMWSGNCNEEYWRLLRQGYKPAEPGTPYVFEKFRYLLNGAGLNARDLGGGKLRLAPMTDKDLDKQNPIEVKNGKLMKPDSLEGIADGLFDPRMVALDKWGKITLPSKLPNPAFENQIAQMLGIKTKDLRSILAGDLNLEDAKASNNGR